MRACTVSQVGLSAAAIDSVMIRFITSGSACEPPAVLSTSRSIRSGWSTAARAATQPPSDSPLEVGALGADGARRTPSGDRRSASTSERVTRLVGISVAEHVDRPGGEVLGVGLEVAHVGLGVTARPVQQHQRQACSWSPGVQVAGAQLRRHRGSPARTRRPGDRSRRFRTPPLVTLS